MKILGINDKFGSIGWVKQVIEFFGLIDSLEQISPQSIKDEHLRDMWLDAQALYTLLVNHFVKMEKYMDDNITG